MEFFVIFSLAASGSVVCMLAEFTLKRIAAGTRGETITAGPSRTETCTPAPDVDAVLIFGLIIACNGAIALVLVSAFPGPLVLERTCLTFAMLSVGGLIREISRTGTVRQPSNLDVDSEAPPLRSPFSRRLSLSLMLMLNLSFAVLSTGQGLIEIVPPPQALRASQGQELDPIIVLAQRSHDTRQARLIDDAGGD
jgi:hypothetical protein